MSNKDAKLSPEAKIYVVRALACRERPHDILAGLLEQWDVMVHRSALTHYDPRLNPRLDPELKSLYERTAREFWSEKEFASFNSLQHRQRLREELYEEAGNNRPLKMQILTEAAKDEGGLYSNRREITGADGAPLLTVENIATASVEDMARILAEFPLSLISREAALFMIEKGFVPRERMKELEADDDAVVEGEVVTAACPVKTSRKPADSVRRPRIKPIVIPDIKSKETV